MPAEFTVPLRGNYDRWAVSTLRLATMLLCLWLGSVTEAEPTAASHPLLPGVRSDEVHSPAWPRTLHDNLATGFSPLSCGMSESPEVWASVELGGTADWIHVLQQEQAGDCLLVNDGRLRLISWKGDVVWTAASCGSLVYEGQLGGKNALLLAGGPQLTLLDAATGRTNWSHRFDPPHVGVQASVADILPERPGLEVAVALVHGEDGCVIGFPPDGDPEIVWQAKLVIPGEFDERYDHHCDLRLDFSVPEQPVIWNVRRYRCRGFRADSGKMISSLEYEIGNERRRNYGPSELGFASDGSRLAVVASENVQLHVHGIRLDRKGESKLAWQHYYGEVYKDAFGVALKTLAIDDLDGDGATEIAYSVRDPAHEFRSFVRVRDANTGSIEWELADYWGISAFNALGRDTVNGILVCSAPAGAIPTQGDVEVVRFPPHSQPAKVGEVSRARLSGPIMLRIDGRNLLLLRSEDESRVPRLQLYDVVDGKLQFVSQSQTNNFSAAPIRAVLHGEGSSLDTARFVVADADGQLSAFTWTGQRCWQVDLTGGPLATLSGADLNEDGRAELLALTPSRRVRVFSFAEDGTPSTRADYEHVARWNSFSPVLYDLEGNGAWCLIAPSAAVDGSLVVCAYRSDGSVLWERTLNAPAEDLTAFVAHAGKFLPGNRAGVAVSMRDQRLTREGTYFLDGPTGKVLWFKGHYRDGPTMMPYRAQGVPTAFDIDGDGDQELGIDMLSYMAFLHGEDGSFAFLHPTPNIRSEGGTYVGHLYNTFCPLYRTPHATAPHWLVKAGFGPLGVMHPSVVTGIWRVDHGYDVPPAVGMIDVDADGELEVGYAAIHSKQFTCRNVWTGEVEWQVELPFAPNAPCMSADVDGDHKGEFLLGSFCIGTDDEGQGTVRWQSPVPLGWSAIADFDGDGDGEIACAQRGRIVILNDVKK